MAKPIHQNHAANIVEKTLRWTAALEAAEAYEPGALLVPRSLVIMEATGPLGARLAAQGWATLAEKVSTHSGRTETAPESTRKAIADACYRRFDALKLSA